MTAKQLADILTKNGYFAEVELAGRYAALRSSALCARLPMPKVDSPCDAVSRLFRAIESCDDGRALEELHAYIEPDYVNWGAEIDAAD
jgi:hypothetical protein